jgi:hypothetical protein
MGLIRSELRIVTSLKVYQDNKAGQREVKKSSGKKATTKKEITFYTITVASHDNNSSNSTWRTGLITPSNK